MYTPTINIVYTHHYTTFTDKSNTKLCKQKAPIGAFCLFYFYLFWFLGFFFSTVVSFCHKYFLLILLPLQLYQQNLFKDICYSGFVMAKFAKKRFYKTPKGPKPLSKQKPKDASTLAPGLERLERAIAHMGLASRREAKALIASGQVKVNGKVVKETGFGINPEKDLITVNNKSAENKEAILVYKPRGIETSKTSPENKDIHDRLPALSHLAPIGRLDKDSEGLIILSNDGSLARALTKENSTVEKEYMVFVREQVEPNALQKMENGIMLDKIKTKPTKTKRLSKNSFTIILTEGRKHQIRRMCDACHLTIESLIRIRIGSLKIGSMKPGFVKRISSKEIEVLKKS